MSSDDTIHSISRDLKRLRVIEDKLDDIRRVDENSISTLNRLESERKAVIDLFNQLEIWPDKRDWHRQYSFMECLEQLRKAVVYKDDKTNAV